MEELSAKSIRTPSSVAKKSRNQAFRRSERIMKPFSTTLRAAYDSKAQVIIIVLTVAVVTAMMFFSLTISGCSFIRST
jgi:hypothetical protein